MKELIIFLLFLPSILGQICSQSGSGFNLVKGNSVLFSVDEIGNGNILGDLVIQNNRSVTMELDQLTSAVEQLQQQLDILSSAYPKEPFISAGMSDGCISRGSLFQGWVDLKVNFPTPPAFFATLSEEIDAAATAYPPRQFRRYNNRVAVDCSNQGATDAIYWFAIEKGTHTIDGKKVYVETDYIPPGSIGSLSFPASYFSSPPAVFAMLDQSVTRGTTIFFHLTGGLSTTGPGTTTFINTVTAGTADNIQYLAMEPGNYTIGRFLMTVGTWDVASCLTCTSPLFEPLIENVPPYVILTSQDTNSSPATYRFWRITETTPTQVKWTMVGSGSEVMHYMLIWEKR